MGKVGAYRLEDRTNPQILMGLSLDLVKTLKDSLHYLSLKCEKIENVGEAVLVLPGYLSSDRVMRPMHNYLKKRGFDVFGFGSKINNPPRNNIRYYDEYIQNRLEEICYKTGKEKINIVGHSLGGVYARKLALDNKEKVKQVLMLGSPFVIGGRNSHLEGLFEKQFKIDEDYKREIRNCLGVPSVSIYSNNDSFVPKEYSKLSKSKYSTNIELDNLSHLGLIFGKSVEIIGNLMSEKRDATIMKYAV